jgi:CDP-paratose 2-epimerase
LEFSRILITGGAGFVGSNLSIALKESFGSVAVMAFDNLKRRGSELNLARLRRHGVDFFHGDVRCREDVDQWPAFDLLIDCSAEPSVQAGLDSSPMPVIANNLIGTIHCMESARRNNAALLFLSTSRVYPIAPLNGLAYLEEPTRFRWTGEEAVHGFSPHGVAEGFSLEGARSIYGATKLAAELLLQEYAYTYKMPVLINRCGILTGPWQMGKTDQGVVTLWLARHVFDRELTYIGYGGKGKQVRDMLHTADLFHLLCRQFTQPAAWDGRVYNVGGGSHVSASLLELTELCRHITGKTVAVRSRPETSPVDLRIYITDHRQASADFDWAPQRGVAVILSDIHCWLQANRDDLRDILA